MCKIAASLHSTSLHVPLNITDGLKETTSSARRQTGVKSQDVFMQIGAHRPSDVSFD